MSHILSCLYDGRLVEERARGGSTQLQPTGQVNAFRTRNSGALLMALFQFPSYAPRPSSEFPNAWRSVPRRFLSRQCNSQHHIFAHFHTMTNQRMRVTVEYSIGLGLRDYNIVAVVQVQIERQRERKRRKGKKGDMRMLTSLSLPLGRVVGVC